MNQSCKTCKFLYVPPNKAGKRVVYDRGYHCAAPAPDAPAMPECITSAYEYRWPTSRRSRWPDDGKRCPTWERLK